MSKQNVVKNGEDTSLDLVVLQDGMVVIRFGKLIKEVCFTPQQAISMGVGLIQWATRGEAVQRQMVKGPRGAQ